MPDQIDWLALGEKLGRLAASIDANTKAAESNTAALAEGQKEFAAIHSDIKGIKDTAPCLNGKPLPPGCPGITATQAIPIPPPPAPTPNAEEMAADGARWLVRVIAWAKEHWHIPASIVIAIAGLCGPKALEIAKAIFASPAH